MPLIDLSQEIYNGMPVYPGDVPTKLEQVRTMERDYFVGYQLSCNMHTGTHLDAPLHLLGVGETVANIPPESCYGRAICLDVRGQIDFDIADQELRDASIVLFYTGWSEYYGTADYYRGYPQLAAKAPELLKKRGIKMVGFDAPSPDLPPFDVHKELLRQNILIIENLCCLEKLPLNQTFNFMAFPLKICAEGSLLRAIAEI